MDDITMLGLIALGVASVALIVAPLTALVPPARRAWRRHLLQRDLAEQAATYVPPRPDPRARAHCPTCGRFAHVTSSGPRGTWMRCAEHGLRLRAIRRIGKPERTLIAITPYRPLVPLPLTVGAPSLAITQTRPLDWLDGVPPRELRRLIAA